MTTAAELVPHLDAESASGLIAAAAFKSKEEIRRLIAARARPRDLATAPAELALASDVESVSGSLAPAQVNSLVDSCAPPAKDTQGPAATAQVSPSRRGRILSSGSGGHEVRLSLTDEEHADLRQAQSLLGHAVPSGDPAVIYARAMKLLVAHLEKKRLGAKPASATAIPRSVGRGIPKPLTRFVWERDGGKCAFVSPDGHRCEATRRLEIDHIQPLALGGATTPENLRLLCRAHNQFEAERLLGKDHVAKKRQLAQRERARDKAAAKSSGARGQARKAASESATKLTGPPPHPHHDDILAALSGLGFNKAEAGRGADLARAQPEASLEACVRLALTVLTRAVAVRGERRAKCSA